MMLQQKLKTHELYISFQMSCDFNSIIYVPLGFEVFRKSKNDRYTEFCITDKDIKWKSKKIPFWKFGMVPFKKTKKLLLLFFIK